MRKLVILFSLLVLSGFVFGDVFITELADPNNSAGSRFVELYNNGASAVDFSTGWQLQRATNGNAYWATAVNLSGTIPAGGFYVVCANNTTFTTTFGFAADQSIGTGGPADSNGDDQIRLLSPGAVVEDMFGILGEDGSGTNHEFEDGRAERAIGTLTGNITYTFAEWNIWNDTGAAGTTNNPQDAPADFDPGSWIGASAGSDTSVQFSTASASASEGVGTYDLTITILNEDAVNATTCDVVLTVGDAADVNSYTTQGVTFPAASSTNQTVTLTVTDDGTFEGDETLTFTIMNVAGGTNADVGTIDELDFTIEDNDAATTTIPYTEAFTSNLGDCYDYSVSGATKVWIWDGGSAYMSGYNSGELEEDWLILPGINMDSYTGEGLSFDTSYNYGSDDASNYLKLYYSTDYPGVGDPTGSAWTEIAFTHPTTSNTLTSSGILDLSAIAGTSVWFGFKYNYNSGSYRNWDIDNVSIVEGAGPNIDTIVNTPASPGTAQTVSVSADITDPDGIGTVEVHWGTATGVLSNTIAMSNSVGDTYVTDTDIPAQTEGTTVYYEVYAEDTNTYSNTSSEFNYVVTDAAIPNVGDLFISELCDDLASGHYTTAYMEITNTLATPVNMENSYIERYSSDGTALEYTYTFGSGVLIPAGGYLIVARGADQATFEAAWGVDLTSLNAAYDNGHSSLYFLIGRSYKLHSPGARAELDTTPGGAGSGERITKQSYESTWSDPGLASEGTPAEPEDDPLPVTLSSFTAVYANGSSTLQWTTQSETNNLGWNVYRNRTDTFNGSTQINEGMIEGAGSTSEQTDYTFTDGEDTLPSTSYWYWIESVDLGGNTSLHGPAQIDIPADEDETAPDVLSVNGISNYPNPFNPSTVLAYKVSDATDASIVIYNTKGQIVKTFDELAVNENGNGSTEWDGSDSAGNQVSSGIYFYKLTAGQETYTSKMIMAK